MSIYTIYALALPVQKPDWKDLKYIGMSRDIHYRFSQHLAGTDESQQEKREWIRSLKEQGTTPVLCSLETVDDIEKAREREQFVEEGLDERLLLKLTAENDPLCRLQRGRRA